MRFMKLALLGAALALPATSAYAASIVADVNTTGGVSFDSSSFKLVSSGTVISGSDNAGTFAFGSAVTYNNTFTTYNNGVAKTFALPVFLYSTGDLSFSATNMTVTYTTGLIQGVLYDFLTITGGGIFSESGYTNTAGTYTLTAQMKDGQTVGNVTSFSASSGTNAITATPEPSSLMLLGTGMLGAAGTMFRKRRSA